MNRSLKTERLYFLGQYQNIKFVDEFNDIPESLMLNSEFINKIRKLQLVQMELEYYKYVKMTNKLSNLKLEEVIPLLEEQKLILLDEITSFEKPKKKTKKEKGELKND